MTERVEHVDVAHIAPHFRNDIGVRRMITGGDDFDVSVSLDNLVVHFRFRELRLGASFPILTDHAL